MTRYFGTIQTLFIFKLIILSLINSSTSAVTVVKPTLSLSLATSAKSNKSKMSKDDKDKQVPWSKTGNPHILVTGRDIIYFLNDLVKF